MSSQSVSNPPAQVGPLLTMTNVSKRFGPVTALANVSLTVFPGEVHTLMGENGAGKSTLMKILSGAYSAGPGSEIKFGDKIIERMTPALSRQLGISVIYQELSLAPNLTVAENISLGSEPHKLGLIDRKRMNQICDPVLKSLGVSFRPNQYVAQLSMGQRQEVEIARALAQNAKLIVMDEPTTSLTKKETDRLFKVIDELRKHGMAIIYISHRMEEIYTLSDRCSVLRDGASVGTLMRDELSSERLVNLMVGRDLSSFYRSSHDKSKISEKPAFKAINIQSGSKVLGCSLECHAGEILGISGLVGSGRTEFARAIFGVDKRDSGEIWLAGKRIDPKNPTDSLSHGLAYLTEDRKELGLFLDMSVSDNTNISVMRSDAHIGFFRNFGKAKKRVATAIKALSIRAANADIYVSSLSGGNQQKVLLARLLEIDPKVLILDEPTRGVDIGAKSEIYALIKALASAGKAVIVISSDLPEIIGISDRVLVMRNGIVAGEIRPDANGEIQSNSIMNLATGAAGNFDQARKEA